MRPYNLGPPVLSGGLLPRLYRFSPFPWRLSRCSDPMNRSGRFGAKGDTVNTTHKIKATTATLTVGFLLAIAFAATAPTAYGREGMTAQQRQAVQARAVATNRYYQVGVASVQQAERLRGEAMNRFYQLGAYSPTAVAAQRAVERRSQAMNRFYRAGNYAVVGSSSSFDWRDTGIGAGGLVVLIVLAGGLTVMVRRHTAGGPSSPSTT